jgi:hypothetical protein
MHVLLEKYTRSSRYRVKLSLTLTGTTLVSLDDDDHIHPAFERCVRNLLGDVHAYKERMSHESERQKEEKGTLQHLQPDLDPDGAAIEQATQSGDYGAFRVAMLGYEEPVRKRVGRWIERYPEVAARIGKGLQIADLVEEVFLEAFDGYDRRPREVRFGVWLEHLIDPAVKKLVNGRNGELDNVRRARAAGDAEMGQS